jgi:predicted RND superfamily exporter protein
MLPKLLRFFEHRWLLAVVTVVLTAVLGVFAGKVRPDYSIEQIFPTFDRSRVDYERFKKDFPFEDAHAVVVVEAPDLFTPAGLARIAALEADLSHIPGVVDTQSLASVRDVTSDGDTLTMEKLFPSTNLPAEELAKRRATATTDPLFRWNLATPDGRATTLLVTLTREVAAKEETRTVFYQRARAVVADHDARARAANVQQTIVLNGLPVIRSAFTEMVNRDLGRLFPAALVVILAILYVTFRSVIEVLAALATIIFSVVWTTGVMGVAHVPLHVLTQVTPIVVMIVSISDTVHVIAHVKDELRAGHGLRQAVARAAADNVVPCLLTEVTIAGGFVALAANDMLMIQQFGLVTAAGMMLTWVANFTVLPLVLSVLAPRPSRSRVEPSAAARGFASFIAWIERVVTTRARTVALVACAVTVVCGALGSRVGKEYYSYDDLRPDAPLAHDLRYVEASTGGSVPMAIYIEPKGPPGTRSPDAMLDPEALALMARITAKLEADYPDDVKSARSLSRYVGKAHALLAGEEQARVQPLPPTRRLAAQELLAIDDPRALRDLVSFDRSTAAVFVMMPDRGSSHASKIIAELRTYFDQEEQRTGYRITLTGIYGIADGIYRSLVGGLGKSLGLSVLVSFAIFFLVLRSWRLALIALVPNVLPLVLTIGIMSLLRIDVKPSTVIVFSITLVIADDDTIQYLSRWRDRFVQLRREGHLEPHREAALGVLRQAGLPMFVTTCAVSVGFLALLRSEFLGLAHLGLLIGVSLLAAVFADLFLTPLLLTRLRPKL